MKQSAATAITATGEFQGHNAKLPLFNFSRQEATWPAVFLLGLAMIGLNFPVGFAVVIAAMCNRWVYNREDFLIMAMFFLGNYSMTDTDTMYFDTSYLVYILGFVGLFVMRKQQLVFKAVILWALYSLALMVFLMLSEETFRNQIQLFMRWTSFIYFLVPLMIFSGREFKLDRFFRLVIVYSLLMSIFYIIDGFILCGNVLVPRTWLPDSVVSTFTDLVWHPFSMHFLRKYPQGLFIYALAIYPVINCYRLHPWMWVVVVLALASTFTFTFITGVVIIYMFFKSTTRNLGGYVLVGVILFTALYWVDASMGIVNAENGESTLRIKSSIDQIINFDQAEDDEDLARVGSGRMAQIIPKVELIYELDREWIGLGFLDRNRTKMRKYIIENEYYLNPDMREEVATGVEMMPVQVFLTVGYIGLLIHILFFFAIWWIIRRLKYSGFFLSAMLLYVWWGLGGFEGLITHKSLTMLATAYAVVILVNRRELGGFALPAAREPLEGPKI